MKTTSIKYGIYSALTIVVLFVIGWFIGKGLDLGYSGQEVVGYTTIIVSLSFVFFGIKHYRDRENDGQVSFGKALLIGILITFFAAIAFGIVDIVYQYLNPNFTTEYYNHHVAELKTTLSGVELETKLAQMEAQRELFSSKTMSFLLMSMTVFVIGFIVSLLSALILQRK
ncbi:MAG: DUF4199 domain-containing protein [Bacteroidetes bacterium]|nr:DUF4199 domain-containing protein [Bacteroidota bacterium]